ncbi:MAG TPA: extracellular solute-binding protein [Chloroflexota bacterium]|jgi:multiple sugar transport system substrate-binding protein
MLRLTRRAAVLGGAALALAARSDVHAQPAAIPLSFWGGWTGPDGLAMQKLVARFNAETPDVRVTLTLYNWDLIFDRWRARFDGGSPPDLVGIHATEVSEFAVGGMLREIGREARTFGLTAHQFLAAPWRRCQVRGGLYAIPLDVHPLSLYINARAARRVGLDPRDPPRSGGALLAWASRMTDRRRGQWGYAAPAGDVECFRQWYSLLYQNGGSFLDPQDAHCLADGVQGVQAFSFLRSLITRLGIAMPAEGPVDADFLDERVLMYPQGPWYIQGVRQAGIELVTAPMPRIGPRPAVWANSHVLAVVNTQDTARVAAAMRFIAWIHDHGLDWAQAGQIPAGNAARTRLPDTAVWRYLRPFVAQLPHIVYQPSLLAGTSVFAEQLLTPVITATRAAMLGQQTAYDAARSMTEGVDQALPPSF